MVLREAIKRYMQDVRDGNTDRFVIFRHISGDWRTDHAEHLTPEVLMDNYAVVRSCASIEQTSEAFVYDDIFKSLLTAERVKVFQTTNRAANAFECFLNENIGDFSPEQLDYLTSLNTPFQYLLRLNNDNGYNLTPVSEGEKYNSSIADDALTALMQSVDREAEDLKEVRTEQLLPLADELIAVGATTERSNVNILPMLIYVASPVRGDIEVNLEKANRYCEYVAGYGHIPIAPHLAWQGFLREDVPEDREKALAMGRQLIKYCSEVWVFGDEVSQGMQSEIAEAEKMDKPVMYVLQELVNGSDKQERLEHHELVPDDGLEI